MRSIAAAGLLVVLLAGCSREPEVKAENASIGEVVNKLEASGAGGQARLRPGQWQLVNTVTNVEMAGVPQQVQAMARRNMMATRTLDRCVTEEEAARPTAEMFGGEAAAACKYERFELGNGRLESVLRCTPPQGDTVVTRMTGTFTPDDYNVESTMEAQATVDGKAQTMKVSAKTTGKRIGDCAPGGSAKGVAK
jgi:hypothetical protein